MKKNVIAVMLSLVLTVGSVGAPVFAAESTTTQEAVETSEEGKTEEEPALEEEDTDEEELTPEEEDTDEKELAPEEETSGEEVSESDPEEEVSEAGAAESEQEDEEESGGQDLQEDDEEEAGSDEEAADAPVEDEEESSDVVAEDEPTVEEEVDEDLIQEEGTEVALAGDVIASGECGDSVTWTLTETDTDMTLIISGSGEMYDYEMNQSPFFSLGFDTVIVEEGVTTLGSSCLRQCGFASITLPDSLESIGESAFFSCNNLESITISDGVTSIGYNAFFYCKKLQSITLPDNLRSIESRAFCYCSSLQSITLPNNLESIGDCAFQHCNSLTSITIPDSVTSLHDHTFDDYPGEIRVYAGSYAETFAKNHNLDYRVICKVHNWNDDYTTDKEPTCTEEGAESIHCSVCDVIDETTVRAIPAKGHHDWNEGYTVDKQPTYTEDGSKSIHCSVCNVIKEDSKVTIPKLPKPVSLLTVSGISAKTYTGKALTQAVVVKDGSKTLVSGTDYKLSYKNNTNAGTATVTITGTGSYTGSASRSFKISPCSMSDSRMAVSGISAKTYTGKELTQAAVVKDGSKTLVSGTDYKVSYKNNINAGTATVTITGIGNYTGSVTKTFKINKAANAVTASNLTRSYSAKAQTITLGAKATGGTLAYKPSNAKVKVTSAGKVTFPAKFTGTVKITVTAGNSNYKTATKTITIKVPAKTNLSKVTSTSAGKMKITWNQNTAVTGYQIQYGQKSSFSGAMKATISKNSTVSRTIKSLNKGKKYYVRIRSFKTVSGKKYYSAWSAKKAVTIKK